jgi:hypothetical protein
MVAHPFTNGNGPMAKLKPELKIMSFSGYSLGELMHHLRNADWFGARTIFSPAACLVDVFSHSACKWLNGRSGYQSIRLKRC